MLPELQLHEVFTMIKGYTYVNLYLFPVHINDAHVTHDNVVGIQRYNSSQWMSYLNNAELDNLHKIVRFDSDNENITPDELFYKNFQLMTDLFDIILKKESVFRNNKINKTINYILRKKEHPVEFTDNRYLARFSVFHPQNNVIILLANPASQNCRTLFKKRQRLNEYL